MDIFDLEELKEYMEEKGYKKLSDFDRFASLTESNFGGKVIVINSTGETVFVQDEWGKDNTSEIEEYPIKYYPDEESEEKVFPGFKIDSDIYYLKEFMVRRG